MIKLSTGLVSYANESCISCKKQHRRCNKTLPICGLCSMSGRTCVYESQPKQNDNSNRPSISDSGMISSIISTLNFNMPVIPHEKVPQIIKVLEMNDAGIPWVDPTVGPCELALVYAVYAMSTKYKGDAQKSKESMEKARVLLAPCLDTIGDNFATAACCCFLGAYYTLEYDTQRANFYLLVVDNFINIQSKQNRVDIRLHFIIHEQLTIRSLLQGDGDMGMILIKYLDRYLNLKKFYQDTSKQDTNVNKVDDEWLSDSDTNKILNDLIMGTNKEYALSTERLGRFSNTLNAMTSLLGDQTYRCSSQQSEQIAITHMIIHGAYLQYFQNIGDHYNARMEADSIIDLVVKKKAVFKRVGVIIAAAVKLHLQNFKDGLEEPGIMIKKLMDDYTAVTLISDGSNFWTNKLKNLKEELEVVIPL